MLVIKKKTKHNVTVIKRELEPANDNQPKLSGNWCHICEQINPPNCIYCLDCGARLN